jgi:acyl-coenzyme A thioesterase PaaI-like protein
MRTGISQLSQDGFQRLRQRSHPHCVVCGRENKLGLQLNFSIAGNGVVEATFSCEPVFQGYPNMLHGGVICALMDGAMANCLFAHGLPAVTADLSVRFRDPVVAGGWATVRAWLEACLRPLHRVQAELVQDGRVKVTAKGKFIEQDVRLPWSKGEKQA